MSSFRIQSLPPKQTSDGYTVSCPSLYLYGTIYSLSAFIADY